MSPGAGEAGPPRAEAHSPSYFSLLRGSPGLREAPVDFCIPCNPYFPTPEVFELLQQNLTTILKYYPSDAGTIAAELGSVLGLQPQTLVMGNGSTELITWIDHLLIRDSVAVPVPTFGRWTDQPLETGKRVDMYRLPEARGFALDTDDFVRFIRARGSRAAVICNPSNPDGGYLRRTQVIDLLDRLTDLDLVVVDESFIDFVDEEHAPSVADEAALRPNVVVLKSLGKNFGLHGIRFGYLVANPALAGTVRRMLPKWNLNSFAEAVVFLLKEHTRAYQESLRLVAADRRSMLQQLSALPGLKVYPSQGNFLLVRLPDGKDGVHLRDHLLSAHNLHVRECGNKLGSSSRFLRFAVRPRQDVLRLADGLRTYLYAGSGRATAALTPAVTAITPPPSAYRAETPAPPAYRADTPASPAYRAEPSGTPASAYRVDTAAPVPPAYLMDASASLTPYRPDPVTPPAPTYREEPGGAYRPEGYATPAPAAPESPVYRMEAPRREAPYPEDPFVVGGDDPRHGRLDPLDLSTRWTFGEDTSPFRAFDGRGEGTRGYDRRS
ncbi:aminotransferase class I/II-fold pyridoxal phosphate-dependent enzyme [Sphaerisporangium sp. B11E5]|uniref:pyridoxal phosphate-dependent aminotransferase n=1 Tax=Sphaerisporangium sp. B11E5 TaxID=3153563 RepID=UPI00325D364A